MRHAQKGVAVAEREGKSDTELRFSDQHAKILRRPYVDLCSVDLV